MLFDKEIKKLRAVDKEIFNSGGICGWIDKTRTWTVPGIGTGVLMLLLLFSSCSQDSVVSPGNSLNESEIRRLKAKYNLTTLSIDSLPENMILLKPHDYQQAVSMLDKAEKSRSFLQKDRVGVLKEGPVERLDPEASGLTG